MSYYHLDLIVSIVIQLKTKIISKTNIKYNMQMINICIYHFMKMNQIVGKQTMSATIMHQKMDLNLTQMKFALIK